MSTPSPEFCQRDELCNRLNRAIGSPVSPSLKTQLTSAITRFQPNERVVTARGQRRIGALLTHKRRIDEVDAAASDDEGVEAAWGTTLSGGGIC